MSQVVKVFSTVHDKFLGYMKTTSIDQQVRFAQVWNEIIDSMRLEVSIYYFDLTCC
jgi:hypothetical protein